TATHGTLRQTSRCYWRLRIEPDEGPRVECWQDAIRAKLDETMRLHLLADVPLGALLSGGVHSSAIVALSAGTIKRGLKIFSIGSNEVGYCELPYAREVAHRYGAQHREEIVIANATGLLDRFTPYFDEPFADTSAIPTYLVAKLASLSVKVVLSGDGG